MYMSNKHWTNLKYILIMFHILRDFFFSLLFFNFDSLKSQVSVKCLTPKCVLICTDRWKDMKTHKKNWKVLVMKWKVSRSVVSDSLRPHGIYSPWNSPGQNTGVSSLFLLQGIFPTQVLNSGLPHRRQILYHLSHLGSPRKWKALDKFGCPISCFREMNWSSPLSRLGHLCAFDACFQSLPQRRFPVAALHLL